MSALESHRSIEERDRERSRAAGILEYLFARLHLEVGLTCHSRPTRGVMLVGVPGARRLAAIRWSEREQGWALLASLDDALRPCPALRRAAEIVAGSVRP